MAKALKIIGEIAIGAALVFTGVGLAVGLPLAAATSFGIGVSASTLLLVGAGLEVAASLLGKHGSTTASQTDRLTTTIDPRAPRKTVYGRTALNNDLRYEEWNGPNQEYCDWIVCLASHKIESLDEVWINNQLAWTLTGGRQAPFTDYFGVLDIVLEGTPSNAITIASGKWNASSSRLTGCAYVHVSFRVTGVNSKATSPFSSGLPSRITFIGRGGMMYDARRDSTVPGGSGPMRAGDQSTWRYTASDGADLGSNIPLMIARELLGWKITNPTTGVGKLAVGSGLPPRRLDMQSFIVAANIADEQANRSAGGTEPKFHGGAALSEGDEPHTRLDMLCAACNGRLRDVNGKLALVIMHNDLAGAAADDGLNDDDVIGAFTWESDPPLDQCVNVLRGKFTDPSTTSLFQLIDYPEVRLDSTDGIDRIMTLDLSVAQSPSHAQRVAKQVLERRQYQRTFSAPFDIRAWKYQVGDVVPLTFSALSFDRRLFRVSAQELGQDGQCVMSLIDENAAIYAWDADDAPAVTAAVPVVYDPTKSPLILGIADAASSADWSLVVDDGGKPTNFADRTSVNTAAAIAGQGAFATLSSAAYGSPLLTGFNILASLPNLYFGSPYLLESSGGAGAVLSAFKTILGTAAGFSGQGPWATFTRSLNAIVNLQDDGYMQAAYIYKPGINYLSNVWPMEADANKTEGRTAAAIAGQATWATYSRPVSTISNLEDSGLMPAGGVYLSGYAYLSQVFPGEFGANRTESRTSAAVAGQGPWATTQRSISSITAANTNLMPYPRPLAGSSVTQIGWVALGAFAGTTAGAAFGANDYAAFGGQSYYITRGAGGAAATLFTYFEVSIPADGSTFTVSMFQRAANAGPIITYFEYWTAGHATLVKSGLALAPLGDVDGGGNQRYSATAVNAQDGNGVWGSIIRIVVGCTFPASSGYQDTYWYGVKVEGGSVATPFSDGTRVAIDSRRMVYDGGVMGELLRPGEYGANVTESRNAAGFAGQTAWATFTQTTAVVSRLQTDGYMEASNVYRSGTGFLSTYFPTTTGADKTGNAQAASIAGQGALATRNSADMTDGTVTNRYAEYLVYGATGQTVATLRPAQALSDVTGANTAAAISGQSQLATAGFGLNAAGAIDAVNIDNYGVGRLSGFWPQEAGSNKTETRNAAGFYGQSAWATLTVTTTRVSRLQDDGYIETSTVYKAGIGSLSTFFPATTGADQTSGANAAGFAGQGRGATANTLADLDPTAAAKLNAASSSVAKNGAASLATSGTTQTSAYALCSVAGITTNSFIELSGSVQLSNVSPPTTWTGTVGIYEAGTLVATVPLSGEAGIEQDFNARYQTSQSGTVAYTVKAQRTAGAGNASIDVSAFIRSTPSG